MELEAFEVSKMLRLPYLLLSPFSRPEKGVARSERRRLMPNVS